MVEAVSVAEGISAASAIANGLAKLERFAEASVDEELQDRVAGAQKAIRRVERRLEKLDREGKAAAQRAAEAAALAAVQPALFDG